MVRFPRFFGKKRGHRRTGSQVWASFGDGVFHAALFAVGLVFAAMLLSGVAVPEWRINHRYAPTTCTIIGTGLVRHTRITPAGNGPSTWQPCLRVRYATSDGPAEAWSQPLRGRLTDDRSRAVASLASWHVGDVVPGWYDPADIRSVVLERGYNGWMWLMMLVLPGALIILGGAGLIRAINRWGRSEERCAMPTRLSGMLDPLATGPRHSAGHPGVPACDDMINSPGTVLAYRLPIESPESWTLIGFGLFAVSWNVVLVVLMVGAGLDFLGGTVDWLLFAFIIPFAGVGIAAVVAFSRLLLLATAVGTTQIEISAQPLRPGGSYTLLLAQGGSGTLESLMLRLTLDEQATFTQGTDTRIEKLTIWSQEIRSWHDLQLEPGTRFEARAAMTIPADAMHSFASEHNLVRWSIEVRGKPTRWPAFVRTFPLVVFPDVARRDDGEGAP